MPKVRLIDANALIRDIAESIRFANEWEKESREKQDEQGVKCAIETRRALQAMISRLAEAPTIEPEVRRGRMIEGRYPNENKCSEIESQVHHGRWKKKNGEIYCTNCKMSRWAESFELMLRRFNFCPNCGADMR